jgi:hypothetical protein
MQRQDQGHRYPDRTGASVREVTMSGSKLPVWFATMMLLSMGFVLCLHGRKRRLRFGRAREWCEKLAGWEIKASRNCGVAPAQHSESFVALGRARIWPEAERTLAFAHGLGERGKRQWSWALHLSLPVPFLQSGPGAHSYIARGCADGVR